MVSQEKENKYAQLLINAYNDGLLKIIWGTSGFSVGIDPRKKQLLPELKEKEFIDYVFFIGKIVIDLADGKEIENISENDLETAKVIYNQEYDLKNHLYIKRNSKINCFKLLESQIISYRNEENPREIEANSAIIKVEIEKDDSDTSYAFEVSKRDLGYIIDSLVVLKEKIDSI